jgi:hypothetical protein
MQFIACHKDRAGRWSPSQMEMKMLTLLNKYKADRSVANAIRVAKYARKHPFAALLVPDDYADLLLEALGLIK